MAASIHTALARIEGGGVRASTEPTEEVGSGSIASWLAGYPIPIYFQVTFSTILNHCPVKHPVQCSDFSLILAWTKVGR